MGHTVVSLWHSPSACSVIKRNRIRTLRYRHAQITEPRFIKKKKLLATDPMRMNFYPSAAAEI